jgi:hypothetical protein
MSVVSASVAVWLSTVCGELRGKTSAIANNASVKIGRTFLIFFDLLGATNGVVKQN